MTQLRRQDPEAWRTFVETYFPLLCGYCRNRGLQHADAEDVALGVLVKVRDFQYDPQRGRFRDWLRTVTRRDLARRSAPRPDQGTGGDGDGRLSQLADDGPDPDWDRLYHAHILERALARVRPELSAAEWHAFEAVALHVVESPDGPRVVWNDQPCAARVAADLGQKVAWLHKLKHRVKRRLCEEIQYLAEDLAVPG
jgi:RNA polymerase sigma-70 factor (ECF subfamily)